MTPVKLILLLALAMCLGGAAAQGTLAKLKFEAAEKAYLAKDYDSALARLKALEDEGLKNPRVLHLKILATNAWHGERMVQRIKARTETTAAEREREFDEMLAFKRDVEQYLQLYDIAGLEDKFREVYQVAETRKIMFDEAWFAGTVAAKHYDARAYDQAMAWFRKALAAGGFDAAERHAGGFNVTTWYFQLGWLHASGPAAGRNPAEAVTWYRKAVARGSTAAMNNLAMLLRDGRDVDKDLDQAFALLTRAAEAGHMRAAMNLAAMYQNPVYGRVDLGQTAAWATKAAERGDAAAMANLAWMHLQGSGVPQDDAKAVAWLGKAAAAGHLPSVVELGDWHLFGRHGLARDVAAARKWYALAPHSDRHALVLYEGLGGEPDYVAARAILDRPSGVERTFSRALLRFKGRGEPQDEAGAADQFLKSHAADFATRSVWASDFKRLISEGWMAKDFPGYAADALSFIDYLNRTRQLAW